MIMLRWLSVLSVLTIGPLAGQGIQIQTQELPWAIVGVGYHVRIEARVDGRCPEGDAVITVAGPLPRGLEMRGEYLTGTAREAGKFSLLFRAATTCSAVKKKLDLTVTGKPILRVYPEALSFEIRPGQDPTHQSVNVFATWAELPYSIKADAAWVSAKPRAGLTPLEGSGLSSDVISVEVAPQHLKPGVYRSILHVFTRDGANAPEIAVTLVVLPPL